MTLRGEPYLLWRAVDGHGDELDVLVQRRRDKATARRFFRRVLRSNPVPKMIVIDQLRSYPAAKAEISEQPPTDPQVRTPAVRLSQSPQLQKLSDKDNYNSATQLSCYS